MTETWSNGWAWLLEFQHQATMHRLGDWGKRLKLSKFSFPVDGNATWWDG